MVAPKNLLRHPEAKSGLWEFDDKADDKGILGVRFKRLIMDTNASDRYSITSCSSLYTNALEIQTGAHTVVLKVYSWTPAQLTGTTGSLLLDRLCSICSSCPLSE